MSVDLTGMVSGAIMRSTQYKFRTYCFNGRNRMRVFDGIQWTNAGISRAEFTPTLTSSGSGITGTYKYYVQPTNSKRFTPTGRKIAGIPSFLSSAITVTDDTITVANIPATHEDSQVDTWDIYRSKDTDYDQFFLLATISMTYSTSATPTSTDTGTDIVTFATAPGWTTGSTIVPASTVGGLTSGTTYFYNAASTTTGSFHTTLAAAVAGTGKVDLTANITQSLTLTTVSYADSTADSALGTQTLEFDQQIPATAQNGVMFGERLFSWGFEPYTTGTVTKKSYAITNKALTTNVVTITAVAHGFSVNEWVTISMSPADPVLDGTYKVATVPTADTFTYAKVATNIVSAAATGTAEQLTFSGSSIPDGFIGVWFKAASDSAQYRVTQRNSATNICIDRAYSGTLSAASFTLYRYPWEVYVSEFMNPEANGPAGEAYRYKREVPGYDHVTNVVPYLGNALVFSATNIYIVTGLSPNIEDIRMAPDPLYKGLGCVGPRAACVVDNQIYFMSVRGPCVLDGNTPRLIGEKLNTDWIDDLTGDELAMAQVYTNGYSVWFWVPDSGQSENSVGFRLDRLTGSWWPETEAHPSNWFTDDGDDGRYAQVYYVQNKLIVEPDYGTLDLVSVYASGTLTTQGTTVTATQAAAQTAFPTTGSGLTECYVRFFSSTGTYKGERRITSNTATILTWSSSGAGGGTLALVLGDTYEIGYPWWTWKSKTYMQPAHQSGIDKVDVTFNEIDAAKSVTLTRYLNTGSSALAASDNPQTTTLTQLEVPFEIAAEATAFAVKLESRNLATVRHAVVIETPSATEQP